MLDSSLSIKRQPHFVSFSYRHMDPRFFAAGARRKFPARTSFGIVFHSKPKYGVPEHEKRRKENIMCPKITIKKKQPPRSYSNQNMTVANNICIYDNRC
ncbi:hypothetical protein Fmac_008567 [Flemingia macrophylla]|uniref:Uncharacterized protein n=1 Tax=Flemingia macrophylla TaxID=520843 RepID=A0ABD1MXS1_9FABA